MGKTWRGFSSAFGRSNRRSAYRIDAQESSSHQAADDARSRDAALGTDVAGAGRVSSATPSTGEARLRFGLVVGFFLIAAACVAVIPLGFVVWLMNYDALSYFLMAQSVARTGVSTASYAVNLPPITYAPGPGYVYAPIMLAFESFDSRIRAIEILNVALYGAFFALSLRYLGALLPQHLRRVGMVAYSLAVVARASTAAAVLLPNADTIPALACLVAFFVVSDVRLNDVSKLAIVTAISLPVFFIKMSAAFLPFALVVLMLARRGASTRDTARLRAAAALGSSAILMLLVLNIRIVSYYAWGIWNYYRIGDGHGSLLAGALTICSAVLSLVLGALPDAIVPNFQFNFLASPRYESMSGLNYAFSVKSVLAGLVSLLVLAAIVAGGIKLWKTRKYDLLVLLLSLPMFALAANSTSRYLTAFQPLLWGCFLVAVAPLIERLRRERVLAAAATVAVAAVLLFTANSYLVLRSKNRGSLGDLPGIVDYFNDVEKVGQGFRTALTGLARDGTSAIYVDKPHDRAQVWLAVANIPSYEIGDMRGLQGKKLILALACRSPWCDQMPDWRGEIAGRLAARCLELKVRQSWQTPSAAAELSAVVAKPGCAPPRV